MVLSAYSWMEGAMNDNNELNTYNLAELTTDMVAAYVGHNSLSAADLPALIHSVYAALFGLNATSTAATEKPLPAVPIKKSVTPDYIVSLEDGRHFKSLKRHLSGRGMTPAEYRAKWGLAKDYPMVAPNYAAKRSELAMALGLGQQRRKRAQTVAADPGPKRSEGGLARPRLPDWR
jgi:predicted transcriptional regulator